MRSFKIYSFSIFQMHNTVLLTVTTMLHITSSELIYLITGNLYSWTTFTHFSILSILFPILYIIESLHLAVDTINFDICRVFLIWICLIDPSQVQYDWQAWLMSNSLLKSKLLCKGTEKSAEQLLIPKADSKDEAKMCMLIRFSGLILQGLFLKEAGRGSVWPKCLISPQHR